MNTRIQNTGSVRGFTLIQISIILTVAALVMVAVLPGYQSNLNANNVTTARMNTVLTALRQYQAANGVLPCPAEADLATGSNNYGQAAANPGYTAGSSNVCTGGTPAANFHDYTNNVAIGMVPVRTLGLSNDYALDGYGRIITYAVDAYATGNSSGQLVWSVPLEPSTAPPGTIIVADNGVNVNTVVALVSHGADGHGAWLPLNAASGTAVRLNAGSTDTDQLVNAHLQSSGTFPNSTVSSLVTDAAAASVTFVKKPPTSTFDDLVVYANPLWNINQLPLAQQTMVSLSLPANNTYVVGENLTFTVTFPGTATVATAATYCTTGANASGTPRLDLLINGVTRYTYCQSGSGTKTLTFSYTLAPSDYASESTTAGFSVASPIDLNSGTITMANSNAYSFYFNLPNGNGLLNGAGSGSTNGTAGVLVSAPSGIVVDGSGNCSGNCINVVDTLNARITQWTTALAYSNKFGSLGTTSNTGTFTNPSGIVADSSNNLYVIDNQNSRVEEWLSGSPATYSSGNYFGSYGSNVSVTTNPTQFNYPTGIAVDATSGAGNGCGTGPCLWIADTGNNRITSCTVAGPGTTCNAMGTGSYNSLALSSPTGIATSSVGTGCTGANVPCIYVADTVNNRIVKFTAGSATVTYVTTFGTAGYGSGNFESPTGIAIDGSGNIWVTDSMNNRVEEFNSTGTWQQTIGGGGLCISGSCTLAASPTAPTISGSSTANFCYNNAPCTAGNGNLYFNNPTGITISGTNVYVVDDNNSRVQVFTTAGVYGNAFGSYGTGTGNFSF